MRSTCEYTEHVAKMIQIRNVPDAVHRKLKARAAMAGMSLSDFLLREMEAISKLPSREEMLDRLSRLAPVIPSESAADAVRAERDSR